MADTSALSPADYSSILSDYVTDQNEEALYRASLLSQACIESGLGPEDIVALHFEGLEKVLPIYPYRDHARIIGDAHQFLLEVMIAYGVKYKEYLELRLNESIRDAESRALRERERAMEAERIQREKTELLAVIAHEMRTPITVARGNIDLASRSLTLGKLEPVPVWLGTAREALDRLSRLSADLVEASQGAVPEMAFSVLDIADVVVQSCDWVRPAAESKGITLHFDRSIPGTQVLGNRDGLLSVLGNILSNAIRYTAPGGEVDVEVSIGENEACIIVKDTGIGMTPEVMARLFEKFYRGHEARIMEAKGLGLGLSLVQQIVQAHSGRIEVESTPGSGSTFKVVLPLVRPSVGDGDASDQVV